MNSDTLDQLKREYQQSLEIWSQKHIQTILQELKQADIQLTPENIEKIIQQTNYSTRSQNHPTACPVYLPNSKPCHEDIKQLNCFLCACPNYTSQLPCACKIDSTNGTYYQNPNIPGGEVWDCNRCITPHTQEFLRTYLENNMEQLKKLSDSQSITK